MALNSDSTYTNATDLNDNQLLIESLIQVLMLGKGGTTFHQIQGARGESQNGECRQPLHCMLPKPLCLCMQ